MSANVKMFRDIDELKIWGNNNGMRFLRDPDDKTKYKVCFTDNDVDKLESFVRQQQTEIEKLRQALQSIANEHVELSHDKIKWQCDDHIRWAKEALK